MLASSSSLDRKGKGPSSPAGASMAALAAAAAAGEDGSDSGGAEGALPPHDGEEDEKPAKLAAVGGASSSSPVAARRGASGGASSSSMAAARRGAAAAAIAAGGGGGGGPSCQADRCNADMSKEDKRYNRRHKVCELHHKAPVVLVAGLRQRFCQQCSRFHELSEFDDTKRSCRQRLAGHNERRRKSSADANANGDSSRHGDQDGRGAPGAGNHFQIR